MQDETARAYALRSSPVLCMVLCGNLFCPYLRTDHEQLLSFLGADDGRIAHFKDGETMTENRQDSCRVNENSHYKNKNYHRRHILKEIPPVEYNDLDVEIRRAGI